MSGLSVQGVSVRYGSTVALDGVSLEVAEGEVVAVIGPSGCGKSTLLRAIAGLEPLAAGRIEAAGRSLDGVATHDRDLGLMFQDHALFPHLSVADNVGFGLRMKGRPDDERRQRVAQLLELVGLAGYGSRSIEELSGGEAQRVALARALAPTPGLLMLDEPFGSLDRVLREQLTTELGRLLDELGQTALHVTHDQAEAFALADRVAVLRDGRVEQVGAPAEVWRAPTSAFVAEFVGHPNVMPVEVGPDGGVSLGSGRLGRTERLAPGRHEVVIPVTAVTVGAGGPVPAVVERVEFDHGRFRVTVRLGPTVGDSVLIVETLDAPAAGESIDLSIDVDQLHPVLD